MKKILISLCLTILICSCSKNVYYSKEVLAENAIKALKNNDFELFKQVTPTYEEWNAIQPIEYKEYNNRISKAYIESQNRFSEKGYNISDFEIAVVNEPYKTYDYEGTEFIRFHVLLKDKQNKHIRVDFSDCGKTKNGYKLGEAMFID